jgi:hypothetical protein
MDDLLARAQSELGRALGRARAGQEGDLSQRVREAGEQLAHVLSALMKLARVHAPENKAFDQPVAELSRVLRALEELLGSVHLVTVEDQVYVNDVRIRSEGPSAPRDLGATLGRHGTGGLTFHAALEGPALRALVAALAADPAPEEPRAALVRRLGEAGLATVEVRPIFRLRTEAEGDGRPLPEEIARRMYALAQETLDGLAAGRGLNPLPLRRIVVSALDADLGAPAFWAPPPPEAPPQAAHAVQVAVVALVLARAARFSPGFLQDLGIAALVHDAGYLSPELAGAPDAFARHPLEGARIVLRQRGFQEGKLLRLRAVLEHHRDRSGGVPPSVAGAILRIAEDYTTIIRLWGARTLRAGALGAMLRATTTYAPALVQLLVNALGLHPPGTIVELEDGRRGRVAVPSRGPELWDRPLVAVLDPASGAPTDELVDCARGVAVRRALPG